MPAQWPRRRKLPPILSKLKPAARAWKLWRARRLPNGIPNRARMKIFSPKPGHTLVFFFKKSLVPYSRDRYSYGGLDLRAPSVEPQEIAAWLDFLTSGFHPDKRPENFAARFLTRFPSRRPLLAPPRCLRHEAKAREGLCRRWEGLHASTPKGLFSGRAFWRGRAGLLRRRRESWRATWSSISKLAHRGLTPSLRTASRSISTGAARSAA